MVETIQCKRGIVRVLNRAEGGWTIIGTRNDATRTGSSHAYRLDVPRCDCRAGRVQRLNRPVTICARNVRTVRQVERDEKPTQCRCKAASHCVNLGHAEKIERLIAEVVSTYGGRR